MNVEVEIKASETGKRWTQRLSMQAPILIGRASECHLPLEDELVSRKHAVVYAQHDVLRIEDTSLNGTLAGGMVLRKNAAEIPWGAPIGIGMYELTFRRSSRADDETTEPALEPMSSVDSDLPDTLERLPLAVEAESLDSERLVGLGMLSRYALDTLRALIAAKQNLLIAGAAGSGKTTLLRALSQLVPGSERVRVIERAPEVKLRHPRAYYVEAPFCDAGQLFRASLRLGLDRLVIGEIRGAEALDVVEALVGGRGGCLTTICATSPHDALNRLETMAVGQSVALRLKIASSVNFILQTARVSDGSCKVTHLTEVLGYDVATDCYRLQDVFVRKYADSNWPGRPQSELVPTVLP